MMMPLLIIPPLFNLIRKTHLRIIIEEFLMIGKEILQMQLKILQLLLILNPTGQIFIIIEDLPIEN